MVDHRTTRDKVWLHVLHHSIREGEQYTAREIADEVGCSTKTAREVCKVAARNRWIRERSTTNGVVYVPEFTTS